VCVLRLSCYTLPVSRTQQPFVLQRQPVETRGRWREEEVSSRIKDETVRNEERETHGNKNTIYTTLFQNKSHR